MRVVKCVPCCATATVRRRHGDPLTIIQNATNVEAVDRKIDFMSLIPPQPPNKHTHTILMNPYKVAVFFFMQTCTKRTADMFLQKVCFN